MEMNESHIFIDLNYKPFKNNSSNAPWYLTKPFSRYWDVYNKCMMYAHKDALSQCLEVKNDVACALYKMVKGPQPETFSENSRRRRISNRKKKKRRKQKLRQKKKAAQLAAAPPAPPSVFVLMDNDTLEVKLEEEISLEDSKEDVDEEFLKFIETSVKHRIKWNKFKEEKKQNQNFSDHSSTIDISEREHPDVIRTREMEELYGSSAAKLHGMETAMQLSFDRLSTLHQPALWPNIPLKLAF